MPNRILRARLRQSQRWNQCCVEARDLYIRLLTLVDDFGRYEAHPVLLVNEAYPWNGSEQKPVQAGSVVIWLHELHNQDMLVLYEVDGKEFLQLTRWSERLRAKTSQFPEQNGKCKSHDSHVTVLRQASARSQSQSLRQSQSPKPKPSSKPIGKIALRFDVEEKMNPGFNAVKIANRIIANQDGWAYDNCKVDPNNLKTASLRTVIEPYVTAFSEKQIVDHWQKAVTIAHGAKVDGLVRDTAAYAVECFKQQLKGKGEK